MLWLMSLILVVVQKLTEYSLFRSSCVSSSSSYTTYLMTQCLATPQEAQWDARSHLCYLGRIFIFIKSLRISQSCFDTYDRQVLLKVLPSPGAS